MYPAEIKTVTIRKATADEKKKGWPPLLAGRRRQRVPKYLLVNPESDGIYTVFGLPQGGETRAEAVFWAERLESKNDVRYVPPAGWENVVGKLP